jgi:hypothetical protein
LLLFVSSTQEGEHTQTAQTLISLSCGGDETNELD